MSDEIHDDEERDLIDMASADLRTMPLYQTAPERIGLAIGDELEDWNSEFGDCESGVTWYAEAWGEPVSVTIGYVREDLYDTLRAQLSEAQARLAAYKEAVEAAVDFAGTVAPGAAWWDDVWPELEAALAAKPAVKESLTTEAADEEIEAIIECLEYDASALRAEGFCEIPDNMDEAAELIRSLSAPAAHPTQPVSAAYKSGGQAVADDVCPHCAKIVGPELAKRCAAAQQQKAGGE